MKKGRQFGRNSSHRKALFRNLVTSLLEHERIETTEAKAKEIRGVAEKIITLGKKGDLASKRMAMSYIRSRDVVAKLFDNIAPRVAERNGGYTRIIKTRIRLGDSAPMAILELVDREGAAPAPAKKPSVKPVATPAPTVVAPAPVVEEPMVEAAAEEPAVVEAPVAEATDTPAAEGETKE